MAAITYIDAQGKRKTGYTKDGMAKGTDGKPYVADVGENGGDMIYSNFLKGKSEDQLKTSPYTDYIKLVQQSGMASDSPYALQLQKNAEDTRNMVTALNEDYTNANTQLYRDYMQQKKNLPQQLAAQGITGGLSESSRLGLDAAYQDTLNQNERARLSDIRHIESAGNSNQLSIMQNYQAYKEAKAKEEENRAAEIAQTMASVGDFSGLASLGYSEQQIADLKAAWDREKMAEIAQTMASVGDFSGYKALGYTDAQIAALEAAYNKGDMAMIAEVMASIGDFSGYRALGFTDEQIAALKAAWDAQYAPQVEYVHYPIDPTAGSGGDDELTSSTARIVDRWMQNVADGKSKKSVVLDQFNSWVEDGHISAKEANIICDKYGIPKV